MLILAPICPPPTHIGHADITRAQEHDYIGQSLTYTCKVDDYDDNDGDDGDDVNVSYSCKPGFEFTEEDLEPVQVSEFIREDNSKMLNTKMISDSIIDYSQSGLWRQFWRPLFSGEDIYEEPDRDPGQLLAHPRYAGDDDDADDYDDMMMMKMMMIKMMMKIY